MEFLGQLISLKSISVALLPVKGIMLDTNEGAVVRQIEEIFRRMSSGMNNNTAIEMEGFMVFVHQLLTETLPLAQQELKEKKKMTNAERNFTVQMKRSDAIQPLKYYEANAHLFIEFGLSLMLTCLKRDKINLKNTEHLQMLDPLIELLGKCIYSKHSQVTLFAIRVFGLVLKAPLPSLEKIMPVVVKRLFQIIVICS
jgi:U3 small nucleolar RNA-associated protein 20